MSVLFPESTSVLGNLKVAALDAVASAVAPDLSTEIGDAETLDLSCFVRGWNPTFESNSGSAPRRACTTTVLPIEGTTNFQAIPLSYVYDPQAATSTDDNKARLKLAQGTELFIVARLGLPYTTAFAVGQYTQTIKVRCGKQNYQQSGDDEFAEFEITQMLYPLTDIVHGQIVA